MALRDRFDLRLPLGESDLGVVWDARETASGSSVVVVRLEPSAPEDLRKSFLETQEKLAKIASPHIVRVLETGTDDDGAPYAVLEHLSGQHLADHLDSDGGATSLRQVVEWTLAVLEGLDVAHSAGVAHGDIEPGNVFLAEVEGEVVPKIIGWGLNRAIVRAGIHEPPVDDAEPLLRSLAFTSPEQSESKRAPETADDLYGVGAILYDAMTGELPRHGTNIATIRASVKSGGVVPTHKLRKEVVGTLSALVDRALNQDPKRRFPDAKVFHRSLKSALAMSARVADLLARGGRRSLTPNEAVLSASGALKASTAAPETASTAAPEMASTAAPEAVVAPEAASAVAPETAATPETAVTPPSSGASSVKKPWAVPPPAAGRLGSTSRRGGETSSTLVGVGAPAKLPLTKPLAKGQGGRPGPSADAFGDVSTEEISIDDAVQMKAPVRSQPPPPPPQAMSGEHISVSDIEEIEAAPPPPVAPKRSVPPPVPPGASAPMGEVPSPFDAAPVEAASSSDGDDVVAAVALPMRLNVKLIGGIGGAVAVLGIILIVALSGDDDVEETTEASSAPTEVATSEGEEDEAEEAVAAPSEPAALEAAVAAPTEEVLPAEPTTVTITVTGVPAGARVTLDDDEAVLVDGVLVLPRNEAEIDLGVSLDGYEPFARTFTSDHDQTVEVALVRVPEPEPEPAPVVAATTTTMRATTAMRTTTRATRTRTAAMTRAAAMTRVTAMTRTSTMRTTTARGSMSSMTRIITNPGF